MPAGFEPDIGASRATAMLYTFANLLKEVYPHRAGAVHGAAGKLIRTCSCGFRSW